MSRRDARRDTAVIPCGPKVDITCAAGHEPELSDSFRMRHPGVIFPDSSCRLLNRRHFRCSTSCATGKGSLSPQRHCAPPARSIRPQNQTACLKLDIGPVVSIYYPADFRKIS
jgi:hypothetical protein